ncbi:MAG: PilZ domain-containing protein [Granulosicoccus sp.]|nr:PilZ domain-containing protein [Granulosicoccus sp.]
MTTNTRKGIITFSISDKGALYSSYMSFVQNGGLFIPTSRNYNLGDEVFILLKVMEDTSFTPVVGNVSWITPAGAQGNKVPGIGIQFAADDKGATRTSIEQYLGAAINRERPVQTM